MVCARRRQVVVPGGGGPGECYFAKLTSDSSRVTSLSSGAPLRPDSLIWNNAEQVPAFGHRTARVLFTPGARRRRAARDAVTSGGLRRMTAPHPKINAGRRGRRAARPALESFLEAMEAAGPLERIELERRGVERNVVRGLADYLSVPASRLFVLLGEQHSVMSAQRVSGSAGYAAMRLGRLVSIARELVAASTHPGATDFDVGKWLGQWLQEPSPALGGRSPATLLDTPSGSELVERVLGSIASGAYQ